MNSAKLFPPETKLLEAVNVVTFVGGQIDYVKFFEKVSEFIFYFFLLVLRKFVVASLITICDKFESRSLGIFYRQSFYVKVGFLQSLASLVIPELLDLL